MIKEQYVSFDVALLLKKKGFDMSDVRIGYNTFDNNHTQDSIENFSRTEAPHLYVPTVTQTVALKWLREKKNCPIEILWHFDSDNQIEQWYFRHHIEMRELPAIEYYDTYEEAEEIAIKYCLEHLI